MPRQLKDIKNFGPVTFAEYESMGISILEQIEALGFERMCRKYVMHYPERLNANAFLGLICSLENTIWTKATIPQRAMAHEMVTILRSELGLPKRKPSRRKRQR